MGCPDNEILALAIQFKNEENGSLEKLFAWTSGRMREYLQAVREHCSGVWDRKSMAEWIGYDLNIDEEIAFRLCERSGFPNGYVGE